MTLSPTYVSAIRNQLDDICKRYLNGEQLSGLMQSIKSKMDELAVNSSLDDVFDAVVPVVDQYHPKLEETIAAFIKNQFLIIKNKYRSILLAGVVENMQSVQSERVSSLEARIQQQADQITALRATTEDLETRLQEVMRRITEMERQAEDDVVGSRDCFGRRRGPRLLGK